MERGNRRSVLVVDDSIFTRTQISKFFERNGCRVIHADNGVDAVEVFRRERPNLTLLDITLPGQDGLAALRDIRALAPTAQVMIITANAGLDQVREAFDRGAIAVTEKPIQSPRLAQLLRLLNVFDWWGTTHGR